MYSTSPNSDNTLFSNLDTKSQNALLGAKEELKNSKDNFLGLENLFTPEGGEKVVNTVKDIDSTLEDVHNVKEVIDVKTGDEVYKDDSYTVTYGQEDSDTILGIPKTAFYVLSVVLIIIIAYFVFRKKK